MEHKPPSKTWIVGCLGAAGVIIAAIIGLGAPFAERLADIYFPTLTPAGDVIASTQIIIEATLTQPVNQPTSETYQQSQATTPPGTSQTDCSKMIEGEHHNPILGTEWTFEAIDENRIIHIWSNHWENNLPEFKYFLPAGQSVSFMSGGGSFWTEKPGCNGVAQVIYDRDTFKEITLEAYQKYIAQKVIP